MVVIGEDGIATSVCEQSVFGTIKDLAILPWNEKFCVPNPQFYTKIYNESIVGYILLIFICYSEVISCFIFLIINFLEWRKANII